MNIEVANRLVELRKRNNLSQEALAEKLGISRQAVSKWERAEASPDTDNLILLARLYHISLDDLLMTGNVLVGSDTGHMEQRQEEARMQGEAEPMEQRQPELVMRREAEPMEQRQPEPIVKREQESVVIIEEERPKLDYSVLRHFPLYIVVVMAFVILGAFWNAWHPAWMLFFIPPIWQSAIMALEKKNAKYFAYPVLVVLLYLCLGFFCSLWHPGWIVFLTIPLYYPLVRYFQKLYKIQKKELDDILQDKL